MEIRDSAGVPLTDYLLATGHGSLLNPLETAVAMVLGLEFIGYMVLVTSAVWVIGFAMSFRWLDPFGNALQGVADALTGQIATPVLLMVAASIGAFFVAWFVMRGYHAKAAMQVVTMVGVGLLGPIVLAEPLAEVMSSNGLLATGRDLGISVAAGLHGHVRPDPDQLVASMQADMADNFARHPVQVWNFGHVVDRSPNCRAAWSAGVRAGDDTRVLNGMRTCGDSAAYVEADHPGMGQIGSGLVLLVCGTIVLCFGSYLGLKVIWAALDAMYHAFMAIFGVAAGGFVYGPTQTFLVRNLVDSFVAAARMTIFTLFLAVYTLFLGNLFAQARDQVMVVLVLGAIVEVVAIVQLRRLNGSLTNGADWITNRFAVAIQGAATSTREGSAGHALGMGYAGAQHAMSGPHGAHAGLLGAVYALNAVNTSPLSSWMFMREHPLDPYSRMKNRAQRELWQAQATPIGSSTIYGRDGLFTHNFRDKQSLVHAARVGVTAAEHAGRGGIDTARGAAAAIEEAMTQRGASLSQLSSALRGAGFTDDDLVHRAVQARSQVMRYSAADSLADKNLSGVVAAAAYVNATHTPAAIAEIERAALVYRTQMPNAVTLHGSITDIDTPLGYVHDYMTAPTKAKLNALQKVADGEETAPYSREGALLMMRRIGTEHAQRTATAVDRFVADPSDRAHLRVVQAQLSAAIDTDRWAAGAKRTPANIVLSPAIR
ncbi:hypothetical protein AB0B25_15435 [Nocardia sp. NPDC049190]|uniref:hypothetical protein n=1 Tax=Nocardia sp. NPDC049190 TaxID=3155650 RepID=UPI0033E0229D